MLEGIEAKPLSQIDFQPSSESSDLTVVHSQPVRAVVGKEPQVGS